MTVWELFLWGSHSLSDSIIRSKASKKGKILGMIERALAFFLSLVFGYLQDQELREQRKSKKCPNT